MDDATIIGFVGALLGALVGAVGTYWATIGAARRQGRDRTRAVLKAVGAYLHDEGTQGGGASAGAVATSRSLQELRALLQQDAPEPDRPVQHRLVLSIPSVTQPAWTALLAQDVSFVPPSVYLKLSELEVVAAHINDTAKQCLEPALNLYRLLRTLPEEFTPRQLAAAPQRPELEAALERLTMLLEILLDLYRQREQLRQDLPALLPA